MSKKKTKTKKRPPDERLLSIPEVAQMKGVTRTAVMVACAQGRIPRAQKPARDWVIPLSAAEAWEPRIRKDSAGYQEPAA